jgi:SAM-dependent methyltransferase
MRDDDLLEEQRAFYRARAPEYDEWWQRRGRYDRGDSETQEWRRQVARVAEAVASFDATGDVLELAGGTGWWTQQLARTAGRLTVVDASSETLALNRRRVRRADVEYVVADIFDWRPERAHDVVFFSFWLSHVPRNRFGDFWSLVGACLAPDGRAFLVDSRRDPTPGPAVKDPYVVEYAPDLHLRRLTDGSEYRVVKVMYEPDELEARSRPKGGRPSSARPAGSSSGQPIPADHPGTAAASDREAWDPRHHR